jgi:hypothetical protein
MDVGTILTAVGSSTLIATCASAVVSWKVVSRQQQVEREKLQHERERHEHEKQTRKRDDARAVCQQIFDELTFMAASMQLLHDNWRFWEERRDDEETREQVRRVYDAANTVNAHMPRLLSDLFRAPYDVLPENAWQELQQDLLVAQQTYGHIVLDALNPGEYPKEAWRSWLLVYSKANMTARRLVAEIG